MIRIDRAGTERHVVLPPRIYYALPVAGEPGALDVIVVNGGVAPVAAGPPAWSPFSRLEFAWRRDTPPGTFQSDFAEWRAGARSVLADDPPGDVETRQVFRLRLDPAAGGVVYLLVRGIQDGCPVGESWPGMGVLEAYGGLQPRERQ